MWPVCPDCHWLAARPVDAGTGQAYRTDMVSDRFRRRTIALIAAYAVALQALFLAFVPLAPAGLDFSIAAICSQDGADGTGHSPAHDLPCAAMCAALGHGVAGPPPPDVSALPALFWTLQTVVPAVRWTLSHIARTEPHAPRGPPLA
jgi:hypothetical protein